MSRKANSNENGDDGVFSPLHGRLLGNDPKIREINEFIGELKETDLTVFISGETGTGKDIVARLIHGLHSPQQRPLVKINCPSIPQDVLESELFGHERGAFSGAYTSRPGRFEVARDGTVFLDEICETSHQFQSKLMQLLDGEPFMRIGGTVPIPMKARVIAAANTPLAVAVAQGRLRKDIAFRLNETVIHLPPLRERRDDIPLLAEHFNYHAQKALDKEHEELDSEILEGLKRLDWPGNVRQLSGRVKEFVATGSRSALLAPETLGVATTFSTDTDISKAESTVPNSELVKSRFMSLSEARRRALEKAERTLIEDTLRHTLWNRRKAAKLLDTSYSSLLRRIAKYQIGKS
ncbi:MAG: AAA domain-containing protein [Nitrospiraceae bacterium]|nr:AAA domain-containing protein [Nitrospiraceae bacterium]